MKESISRLKSYAKDMVRINFPVLMAHPGYINSRQMRRPVGWHILRIAYPL